MGNKSMPIEFIEDFYAGLFTLLLRLTISYFDIAVHSIHVDIIIGKVGHVDIFIVTKIPIKMSTTDRAKIDAG